MLNMKKGLAIVLAAATAFTFAPVSTLGQSGVVEAQAGDTIDTTTVLYEAKTQGDVYVAGVDGDGKIVASDSNSDITLSVINADGTADATKTVKVDNDTAVSLTAGQKIVAKVKSDKASTLGAGYAVSTAKMTASQPVPDTATTTTVETIKSNAAAQQSAADDAAENAGRAANSTKKDGATEITESGSYDIEKTIGDVATYFTHLNNKNADAQYYVSTSDPTIVELGYSTDGTSTGYTAWNKAYAPGKLGGSAGEINVANGNAFAIKARSIGTATITVKESKYDSTSIKTFTVKVKDLSDAPQFSLAPKASAVVIDSRGASENTNFDVTVFTPAQIIDSTNYEVLTVAPSAKNNNYTVQQVTVPAASKDLITAQKASDSTVDLKFTGVGTANIELSLEETGKPDNKPTVTLTFKISKIDSTLKVDEKEISTNTQTSDTAIKTIALTEANPTADLGAALTDQKSGEALTYFIYRTDKDGVPQDYVTVPGAGKKADTLANLATATATQSGDLTIADGKVTATANALNATEQYYAIAVANKASTSANKVGWIRVVSIRNSKLFTNVKLSVDGNDYTSTAKYNKAGDTEDGSETKSLEMSMLDFTSADFTATGNGSALAASEISSSDPSTVAVEGNKLVAKKLGTSIITFTKKSDTTHYGNATITLNVTVANRYVKNEITADDIVLTKANLTAKINAKSTPATTYHYEVGHGTADKWTAQSDAHIAVAADGTVTFDGTGYGATQILITGDAKNDAKAPKAKVINVTYSNLTETDLNVTTKTLKLTAGESGAIVATGTALSYVSSDEDVATVDANGNVTAVAAGTAVITVKSAGSATVAPAQDTVIVTVKAAYKDPSQVTGVKVGNKKGANVVVKFTKDSTSQNIKYYVQKKVGSKTSGKSVGSNRTILSVAKGKTVKVRVKAYYYDANGTKHVGKYSEWVTKKTDKK